jgi:hypothetical protein
MRIGAPSHSLIIQTELSRLQLSSVWKDLNNPKLYQRNSFFSVPLSVINFVTQKVASRNSHNKQSNYREWRPCVMQAPGHTGAVCSTWYVADVQDSLATIGKLYTGRKHRIKTLVLQDGCFATRW